MECLIEYQQVVSGETLVHLHTPSTNDMVELDQGCLAIPASSECSAPKLRLRLELVFFSWSFCGVSITRHWSVVWQSTPARTHKVHGRLMSH